MCLKGEANLYGLGKGGLLMSCGWDVVDTSVILHPKAMCMPGTPGGQTKLSDLLQLVLQTVARHHVWCWDLSLDPL